MTMAKQVISESPVRTVTLNNASMMTKSQHSVLNALRINMAQIYAEEGNLRSQKHVLSLIELFQLERVINKSFLMSYLHENPQGIKDLDSFGGNVLHCACRNEAPSDVIIGLVEYMPSLLERMDVYRELPLHIALQNGCSLEAISAMVRYYPQSLRTRNGDDELPLNLAVITDAPEEIVSFLVHQDPSTLETNDSIGQSTFHSILSAPTSLALVQECLQKRPNIVSVENFNGQLPLHTAAMCSPSNIVAAILNCNKHAALKMDEDGNLPLHCAVAERTSFATVKLLVDSAPESLQMKNRRGLTPLDVAMQNNACNNTINYLRK